MVMNYGLIDTYLHMSNHYKLINSAKSVVNTSPPKSFILKSKKQSASSPSTRYSTPTLLSKNDRLPSRANSHYEFGRKNIKIHNCLQNDLPVPRSGSASSQKYSRKISTTWNSNFLKNKPHFTTKSDTKSKTSVTTNNSSARVSRESSNYSKPEEKQVSYDRPKTSKTPIPTPRKKLPSNKSMIPNYEYLQFSLRITEDIIRNDLYNSDEMQRVFNSHLEANRGRLDMTKMIEQIDHLCKELSITANVNTESDTKSSELTLRHNSKQLLDKIANRQYEMSSDEIRNLSGTELQNLITGILDQENSKKEVPLPIHFQSNDHLPKKECDELLDATQKQKTITTTTSDESTKYFDIVAKNSDAINSKESDEQENVCTDLIPMSLVSQTDKPENEIESSVKISQNIQNKEITIINLEVNQLHNDLVEINKKLTEGFLNLKETILTENPEKEEITDESEVSIKKNEITQTPFSKEIAQFFDKFPENLTKIAEDKKQTEPIVFENKDVLHFVGITEKVEIENLTETYEQINIYEPINIEESNTENPETIRSSENVGAREIESNFITSVNNLLLDGINDLFEPILCKDIVLNINTGDYYKYENKNHHNHDDKYIKSKYKLHEFPNRETVSQKSSEISLSEGEILVNSKPKRKENPNILKVLEKYECKTYDHNSINKYKLNKFELHRNYDSQVFYSSTTTPLTSSKNSRITLNRPESLLSDGEIKYSSDSDDCKTDYSNNSSKV